MSLVIPDEVLATAGLSEAEARLEVACRLFDAGKLPLWDAAQWVAMSRVEFEAQLLARGIAIYRPTPEDLRSELEAMDRLGIPG